MMHTQPVEHLITDDRMGFYESLIKPSWVPPDWAFPVGWFTLWALQAVVLVRLAGSSSKLRHVALVAMIVQFVFAVAWQAAVFAPGRLLVLVIIATSLCWMVDRWSAVLVAPTVVWVSVATTLAWSLYRLNPGA
jgi:translocator protein